MLHLGSHGVVASVSYSSHLSRREGGAIRVQRTLFTPPHEGDGAKGTKKNHRNEGRIAQEDNDGAPCRFFAWIAWDAWSLRACETSELKTHTKRLETFASFRGLIAPFPRGESLLHPTWIQADKFFFLSRPIVAILSLLYKLCFKHSPLPRHRVPHRSRRSALSGPDTTPAFAPPPWMNRLL